MNRRVLMRQPARIDDMPSRPTLKPSALFGLSRDVDIGLPSCPLLQWANAGDTAKVQAEGGRTHMGTGGQIIHPQRFGEAPRGQDNLEEFMERLGTPLTARELDVIRLILSGCSNKEVAGKLAISAETVKVHRRHIYSPQELFALFLKAQTEARASPASPSSAS